MKLIHFGTTYVSSPPGVYQGEITAMMARYIQDTYGRKIGQLAKERDIEGKRERRRQPLSTVVGVARDKYDRNKDKIYTVTSAGGDMKQYNQAREELEQKLRQEQEARTKHMVEMIDEQAELERALILLEVQGQDGSSEAAAKKQERLKQQLQEVRNQLETLEAQLETGIYKELNTRAMEYYVHRYNPRPERLYLGSLDPLKRFFNQFLPSGNPPGLSQ